MIAVYSFTLDRKTFKIGEFIRNIIFCFNKQRNKTLSANYEISFKLKNLKNTPTVLVSYFIHVMEAVSCHDWIFFFAMSMMCVNVGQVLNSIICLQCKLDFSIYVSTFVIIWICFHRRLCLILKYLFDYLLSKRHHVLGI